MTKQLIRAGQRILGCATAKGKHPLKVEHLKALQDKFAFASLDQLQIVTLATLGFAGFLRWDDLSRFKTCDIDFHRGFIKIFLESARMINLEKVHGFILLKPKRDIARLVC